MGWRDNAGDDLLGGGLPVSLIQQRDGLGAGYGRVDVLRQVQRHRHTYPARRDQYQDRAVAQGPGDRSEQRDRTCASSTAIHASNMGKFFERLSGFGILGIMA